MVLVLLVLLGLLNGLNAYSAMALRRCLRESGNQSWSNRPQALTGGIGDAAAG